MTFGLLPQTLSRIHGSGRLFVIVSVLLLGGCAVTPEQFSVEEIQEITSADRALAMRDMAPVGEMVTLDEAIARALKYNLTQRVRLLEQSLAASTLEAGQYDMLPQLMANAGYAWRSNDNIRFSADPATPEDLTGSTPFISTQPRHNTADLTLSWNLLDFGAGYYNAKQNADRLLIANEKRRRAMHTLMLNVRTAYWRAVAAESLAVRVRATIDAAEGALTDSRQLAKERVSPPEQSLRFQRNLLENLRLLEDVERELAAARIELANLMGLSPSADFRLETPSEVLPPLDADMLALEQVALLNNADLREQFHSARIAAMDTRKALLELLPGLKLDFGFNHDNDFYLENNQWQEAGVEVSYNLFSLLSAPVRMDAAEKNMLVAEARRMALQMTVLTQVHLARYQYQASVQQFERADAIYDVDRQLEEIMAGRSETALVGQMVQISASVTSILSEVRRYQAMARVQEAIGQMQASLGMEPQIDSIDTASLADVQSAVRQWLEEGMDVSRMSSLADIEREPLASAAAN